MAKLYIAEFNRSDADVRSHAQVAACPPLIEQTPVAIGGASAQSAAFGDQTNLIRLHADAICSVKVGGTNPTATASTMRLAADQTEYFAVKPGDKVAVISNT